MSAARRVALQVNGMRVTKAKLCLGEEQLELIITDPNLGDFPADRSFPLELLDLVHPPEIRSRLPNGGWRRISLRILILLLETKVVRVVEEN